MSEKVLAHYNAENGIATITLDDPPVNGYTHEMNRQVAWMDGAAVSNGETGR